MKYILSRRPIAPYCTLGLILFLVLDVQAQFDSLGVKTSWNKGSITLRDNVSIQGQVQFNDKLGTIMFRKNPDDEPEMFSEINIAAMTFYDEKTARWRKFGTFDINDVQTGRHYRKVLEILMEFKDFALLSRAERVNFATRNMLKEQNRYPNAKIGYVQFERFLLIDAEGIARDVLVVNEFERDKFVIAKDIKPFLNKEHIKKYLKDDWTNFQAIVKTNKLKLKKKEDFLAAFEKLREVK